jgi:hypothetical protein
MVMRRRGERDIVRELQEDAKWSSRTNSIERWRGRPRGSVPHDPSIRTFMLTAVFIVGIVLGVIGLVVLLLGWDKALSSRAVRTAPGMRSPGTRSASAAAAFADAGFAEVSHPNLRRVVMRTDS